MSNIKKLPSALSDEELLKQLEKVESEEVVEQVNNVVSFLLFYNIEPGKQPVKNTLLYNLYKAYTKEPVNKESFNLTLTKYLPNKKYGLNFYLINQKSFKIADKTFKLLDTDIQGFKSPRTKRHFENFLKNNNLEDGSVWISADIIFQNYLLWCRKVNRKRPISKPVFYKFLGLYFKKMKIIKHQRYYSINRKLHETQKENTEKEEKQSPQSN